MLFASGLLGRIVTTAVGGGDEVFVARALLPSNAQHLAVPAAIGVAFAATIGPLYIAWRALGGRLALFLSLLIVPFVAVVVVVLLFMNAVLSLNLLRTPSLLGAAPLVHLYGLLLIGTFPLVWRRLQRGV